jgi:arylformamidase
MRDDDLAISRRVKLRARFSYPHPREGRRACGAEDECGEEVALGSPLWHVARGGLRPSLRRLPDRHRGLGWALASYDLAISITLVDEQMPAARRGFLYSIGRGGWPIGVLLAAAVFLGFNGGLGLDWHVLFLFGVIPLLMVIVGRRWVRPGSAFSTSRRSSEQRPVVTTNGSRSYFSRPRRRRPHGDPCRRLQLPHPDPAAQRRPSASPAPGSAAGGRARATGRLMPRIRTDRLWDLSQPVAHDGPAWAGYNPPVITRNYHRSAEGFNAETLTLNTHTGTHVDVPFHFDEQGATVDQVPLSAFAAPAVFVDLRNRVAASQAIGREQLTPLRDLLKPGDIAVLVTGWGQRRAVNEEFLKRWPCLDGDGVQLLLEREISGVGIDALSIGGWGGPEKRRTEPHPLLGSGKLIIADLSIPDELVGRRCFITAFPVLLQGCGDAWTRAVAWELDC